MKQKSPYRWRIFWEDRLKPLLVGLFGAAIIIFALIMRGDLEVDRGCDNPARLTAFPTNSQDIRCFIHPSPKNGDWKGVELRVNGCGPTDNGCEALLISKESRTSNKPCGWPLFREPGVQYKDCLEMWMFPLTCVVEGKSYYLEEVTPITMEWKGAPRP